MKEGKDYLLIEDNLHQDQFLIQLTSGDYTGVVYRYGKVSIIEENDQARLKFVYKIESVPDHGFHTVESLNENVKFKKALGDVLSDIILNNDYKIGNMHE